MSAPRRWPRRPWSWLLGGVGGPLGGLVVSTAIALASGWNAFGKRAEGARLARSARSPEWGGRGFVNPQPLRNDLWLSLRDAFAVSPDASPTAALPLVREPRDRFIAPPPSGLRATWLFAPRPGQSFEPALPPPLERWWPNLPWKAATDAPIVSTQME